MPHDVFVSHSEADKLVADAMCARLEAAGIRCWIAPRDIAPGADWTEAILHGISVCKVFVLVFSARANASKHVQRELANALENRLTVIPFRVEKTTPSGSLKYYLATVHWLDAITPPIEKHLETLTERVTLLLAHDAKATDCEADAHGQTIPVDRLRSRNSRLGLWAKWAGFLVLSGLILWATAVLTPLGEWLSPLNVSDPIVRAQSFLNRFDKEGFIQHALDELDRVSSSNPSKSAEAMSLRALAYWRLYRDTGDFKSRTDAFNAATNALGANAEIAVAHYVKGLVERDRGDRTGALKELIRANALEGEEDGVVLLELAGITKQLGHVDQELQFQGKAAKVRRKDWIFYNDLAKSLYGHGDWSAAITNGLLATQHSPGNSVAECNLANYYLSLADATNHLKEAWIHLENARKYRPGWGYQYSLGQYYRVAHNSKEAAASFRRAAELKPKDYRLWGGLGLEMMRMGLTSEGREYLTAAISKAQQILTDSSDCLVVAQTGLYHAYLNQPGEAMTALRKALTDCPDNSQVRETNESAVTALEDAGNVTDAATLRSLDKGNP